MNYRNYRIEIQYRKGPVFETEVTANSAKEAEKKADSLAKQSGFTYPVKKVITKPQGN